MWKTVLIVGALLTASAFAMWKIMQFTAISLDEQRQELKSSLHETVIPPKEDKDENTYHLKGTILLYSCRDNIAIENVYTNSTGAVIIRLYSKWNANNQGDYLKLLRKLENDYVNRTNDAPIEVLDIQHECSKS